MFKRIAAALACMALAACVTYALPEGATTATLISRRSFDSSTDGIVIRHASDNTYRIGELAIVGNPFRQISDDLVVEIESEERIFLSVAGYSTTTGIVNTVNMCTGYFSFIPETGRTYYITDHRSAYRCTFDLIDSSTNQTPDSLRREDAPEY